MPDVEGYAQGSIAGVPILDDNGATCRAVILDPWGPLNSLISNVLFAPDGEPFAHLVDVGNRGRPLGLEVIATKTLLNNVVSAIKAQMLSNGLFHVTLFDLASGIDADYLVQGDQWVRFPKQPHEGRVYDKSLIGIEFHFIGA